MVETKKTAPKEEEWQESVGVQGDFVRWEKEASNKKQEENTVFVGNPIQGIYEKKQQNVGENASNVYVINHPKHGVLSIWDTTVLNDRMEKVPVGSEVIIEMLKVTKPKGGGKAYFDFSVKFRKGPMVEVQTDEEKEKDMEDEM